jgi:hypothetical protein
LVVYAAIWLGLSSLGRAADLGAALPINITAPRVFALSRFSIDEILNRPFDADVPIGCTGDRVWASSPQGWAFGDDTHWLDQSRVQAFDLEIRDEHGFIAPAQATYYPSHVHYGGATRSEMRAAASFTCVFDRVSNPLDPPYKPEKRWTCWSSGKRQDWYEVEFPLPRTLQGFDLDFFDDAPQGGCRPPQSFEVLAFDDAAGGWQSIERLLRDAAQPRPGENHLRFQDVTARRFRFVFHHAGRDFYTGLYGLRPIGRAQAEPARLPLALEFRCDKFITPADTLVSVVRVHNPTDRVQTIYVEPVLGPSTVVKFVHLSSGSGLVSTKGGELSGHEPRSLAIDARQEILGYPLVSRFRYAVLDDPARLLRVASVGQGRDVPFRGFARPWVGHASELYKVFGHHIQPGKTKIFKAALETRMTAEASNIASVVKPASDTRLIITPADQDARDLVDSQIRTYQSWFDANLAYFDCSDRWIRKMYYHRAYLLRKNMLDPKLGRLQWPTQSEGRWRSPWYPNIISYGAAHQIREARWLRDRRYWRGHLRTWAENAKADGVYPSHVTTKGPAGGQYTDWITSAAWEGHLVHPDQDFLSRVVGKLAANVRGWQRQCDTDGDGLLEVDSHWWTGMEYQPSFFFFSDYQVSKDFDQPARRVSLERVDLTAYNYGNAAAVAKIYRRLGQPAKAKEFDDLAAKIATSLLTKMWHPEKKYFYSLRATDGQVADVKEVVGVYPFYFGMVPSGRGFEAAWASILDSRQFWTRWPVASASRVCPAYSQTSWPGDGRAAGCMWNGPTWPHANSLVMSGMARTLRAMRGQTDPGCPLAREHLWKLFSSFTQAQFRNQDFQYPWTGEFYNGDTGQWKTAERDYNHSTWLDILIPDILGLVPRDDEVLEIDPLVPADALSYFILDGQRYHGHDVTLVWDAPEPGSPDRFGDGRKGLDVYVDGRLRAAAPRLARLLVGRKRG